MGAGVAHAEQFPVARAGDAPGVARAQGGSSNPIVLTIFFCGMSITLTTLLFIHPMFSWMGIGSKFDTR